VRSISRSLVSKAEQKSTEVICQQEHSHHLIPAQRLDSSQDRPRLTQDKAREDTVAVHDFLFPWFPFEGKIQGKYSAWDRLQHSSRIESYKGSLWRNSKNRLPNVWVNFACKCTQPQRYYSNYYYYRPGRSCDSQRQYLPASR
jgi:hypothetical protein